MRSHWETTPGLHKALAEVLAENFTAGQAATYLTLRFKKTITRNAVIGRAYREGLKIKGEPTQKRIGKRRLRAVR